MTPEEAVTALYDGETIPKILAHIIPAALDGDVAAAHAAAAFNLGRHLTAINTKLGHINAALNDIHAKPKIPTTDIRGIATYTKEAAHALNDVRDLLDEINRGHGL